MHVTVAVGPTFLTQGIVNGRNVVFFEWALRAGGHLLTLGGGFGFGTEGYGLGVGVQIDTHTESLSLMSLFLPYGIFKLCLGNFYTYPTEATID